ncbi:MAG: hypothetical protein M3245_05055, partial [Actinomycetota bacterium]|nr:hypothetical protein [Actinomycetota bacterium]
MHEPRSRRRLWPAPVHPLLFAAFPVLFLFSQNVDEGLEVTDLLAPLGVVLGATLVVYAALSVILRDARRGAIVTSAWALLFLSYGHVRSLLAGQTGATLEGADPGAPFRGDPLLAAAWAVAAVAAVVVAVRLRERSLGKGSALALVAGALVVINVVPIVLA